MIQSFGYNFKARYLLFAIGIFVLLSAPVFAAEDTAVDTEIIEVSDNPKGVIAEDYELKDKSSKADYAEIEGLPQLDFSTYTPQIFWLVIIFGIMYIFFTKKSLPDISFTIESRKNHIDADLTSAEKLQSEAETVQQHYEESLKEARSKASETIANMDKDIKDKTNQDISAFQKRAEQEVQDIESRIEKAKADAMDNMNDIATEVAADAVQKIIGVNPDTQKAKSIVESLSGKAKAA